MTGRGQPAALCYTRHETAPGVHADVPHGHEPANAAQSTVLDEVAAERERQNAKWGEQNHPHGTGPNKLPMPYNSGSWSAAVAAEYLKLATNIAAERGYVTWLHILREEVFEAFAEEDPAKLRTELIQVAAVAAQWVEAIDRAAS